MNGLKKILNEKKVPLNLHESLVVSYAITKEKICFRFAVPCYLNAIFADNCRENFYLVDFIAYNPKLIDYELLFLDSLLPEVISFEYIENEYRVIIAINGEDWNKIVFTTNEAEWIPLRRVTSKELDNIKNCDFRYIQYP